METLSNSFSNTNNNSNNMNSPRNNNNNRISPSNFSKPDSRYNSGGVKPPTSKEFTPPF